MYKRQILNIAWDDKAYLIESTLHTLRLLFLGYFIGVSLGLVTGITCGYSKKVRYWIDPIIKFLGPIPTSTWIPIIMVVSTSLFGGAVFIIALGSWFCLLYTSVSAFLCRHLSETRRSGQKRADRSFPLLRD